jgi:hypothetical protein
LIECSLKFIFSGFIKEPFDKDKRRIVMVTETFPPIPIPKIPVGSVRCCAIGSYTGGALGYAPFPQHIYLSGLNDWEPHSGFGSGEGYLPMWKRNERRRIFSILTRASEKVTLTVPSKLFNKPATPLGFLRDMGFKIEA